MPGDAAKERPEAFAQLMRHGGTVILGAEDAMEI
jgi:hypothetical protein